MIAAGSMPVEQSHPLELQEESAIPLKLCGPSSWIQTSVDSALEMEQPGPFVADLPAAAVVLVAYLAAYLLLKSRIPALEFLRVSALQ